MYHHQRYVLVDHRFKFYPKWTSHLRNQADVGQPQRSSMDSLISTLTLFLVLLWRSSYHTESTNSSSPFTESPPYELRTTAQRVIFYSKQRPGSVALPVSSSGIVTNDNHDHSGTFLPSSSNFSNKRGRPLRHCWNIVQKSTD